MEIKHSTDSVLSAENETSHSDYARLADVVWGVNAHGQTVKKGDKLLCGTTKTSWHTHVQFDEEMNRWHREQDYFFGKVVGSYNVS